MRGNTDPFTHEKLARQLVLQKELGWDLEKDIPWERGVDSSKYLLPLDDLAIAFPGASSEQKLALSQWMGLVVNSTISEMEDALPNLKYAGWRRLLENYPVGPEMMELGELFFEEEAKHARGFNKYVEAYCDELSVDRVDLAALLPKAFGSQFHQAITRNAMAGGHAFWWVVALTEEISMDIYGELHRHRQNIDPLYLELHRKHLEEEARHANYAFLMLDIFNQQPLSWRKTLHRKTDFIFAQLSCAPWVMGELHKFFKVKKFKGKHPLFDTLASCIPLYESLSKPELIQRMFVGAPYVSWLLNPKARRRHVFAAKKQGALIPWTPNPQPAKLSVVA